MEVAAHTPNRRALEKIGTVFDQQPQSVFALRNIKCQIELGRPRPQRLQSRYARGLGGSLCVVQNEHDLKNGRMARRTLRGQLSDQLLKWQILAPISAQRLLPD